MNIVEKETATEHTEAVHVAGRRGAPERDQPAKIDAEKILDGQVDGRWATSVREFQQSLADSDRKAKEILGDKAKLYKADNESGKCSGAVITESQHHVVQKLSPKSAVAHAKRLLPEAVQSDDNLVVFYSNGIAQLKPSQMKDRAQALSR